jgi:N utilization substance protein B
MPSPRTLARAAALQVLYAGELLEHPIDTSHVHALQKDDMLVRGLHGELFLELVKGCLAQRDTLKERLAPFLDRPMAQLDPVERCVLLIAAHELTTAPLVPARVVINEAINLAKAFGAQDSHHYINGVLDAMAKVFRSTELASRT